MPNQTCVSELEKRLQGSVPWVGMYIAIASAACALTMAADAVLAFRARRFWIPCRFFRLNAFSLMLMGVEMKLPFDYTAYLNGLDDKLARCGSLVLMSTTIGYVLPSLGLLGDKGILVNVSALGILVITVAGNLFLRVIHVRKFWCGMYLVVEELMATSFMFPVLVMVCSSAVMVPSARRHLESMNREMRKRIVITGKYGRGDLKKAVKKHWVMAETGNLQFVIARSQTSAVVFILCVLIVSILLEAIVRLYMVYTTAPKTSSPYKWSIEWILFTQAFGIFIGIIVPLRRMFVAVQFRGGKSFKEALKVESYWTQTLVEWRESLVPLQIQNHELRKLVHDVKEIILNFFIGVQILIIVVCKLLIIAMARFSNIFCGSAEYKRQNSRARNSRLDPDLNQFVLLLEGEEELTDDVLTKTLYDMERLIENGKKKSENLIELLRKARNFKGEIPSPYFYQEAFNSWPLLILTLTTIALAISDASQDNARFLRAIREGLDLLKLIDHENGWLVGNEEEINKVWARIELHGKWFDLKIRRKTNVDGRRSFQNMLKELSDVAKGIFAEFGDNAYDLIETGQPFNILSAYSMFSISETLMQTSGSIQKNEQLFDQISAMIAHILATCFAENLKRVVISKCDGNTIREWEKNVEQAAVLFGQYEEIFNVLEDLEYVPTLDADRAYKQSDFEKTSRDVLIP